MKSSLNPAAISKAALNVADTLRRAGYEGLLVGGCVRDLLLGRTPKDFDVITDATPEQVAGLFRRARVIGRRFRLALVRERGEAVEVSTYRGIGGADGADHPERTRDGSGRILDDNLFGTREQDVMHRDFTVNALYYDPVSDEVIDYVGGVDDIQGRTLRCIGEPERRYREDPVRMLRAVRFAASLDFALEPATEGPLRRLAPLVEAVPAARLYGETIKLLHSGSGVKVLEMLRHYRLMETLLPLTARCMDASPDGVSAHIVPAGLANTDDRIREGKPVIAPYLYAVMLWESYQQQCRRELRSSLPEPQARALAADKVLARQGRSTGSTYRLSERVREIWDLQPLLEGSVEEEVMSNPRFRAAYDFLLLRATHDASLRDKAAWWTKTQAGRFPERPPGSPDGARRHSPGTRRRSPEARRRHRARAWKRGT